MGRVNVDAMLRELTAKQFMEWEIYAQLEPFDETRADYRAASIATMIANVNRGTGQSPYKLTDFLLNFGESAPKKKQTVADQLAMLDMIKAIYSVKAEPL